MISNQPKLEGTTTCYRRESEVLHLSSYRALLTDGLTQQEACERLQIPRSTLRYWLSREESLACHDSVVHFFESPSGYQLLRQIVVSLHLCFHQSGHCGIDVLCHFLKLSGLNAFIASSHGSQYSLSREISQQIIDFGREESQRLGEQMPPKALTLIEDETFHRGKLCLVALEALSNFILVEQYSTRRDQASWDSAVKSALQDWPVAVRQVASDEAQGLKAHITHGLGAHHSSDLFHGLQDLTRATALPLQQRVDTAETALQTAQQELRETQQNQQSAPTSVVFNKFLKLDGQEAQQRQEQLQQAQSHQEQAKQAIQNLSSSYHLVNLSTATLHTPETLGEALTHSLDTLQTVAEEAQLPQKSQKKINRVQTLVASWQATLAFVLTMMEHCFEQWQLNDKQQQMLRQFLIPYLYLKKTAQKADTAETREALLKTAKDLYETSPWKVEFQQLTTQIQNDLLKKAEHCVDWFQRSSSPVEGRNGQLALKHHQLHQLGGLRLEVLTHLHNFFITRDDGTTPAQRFFEKQHRDLFEFLLNQINELPRPAKSRSKPKVQETLMAD